MTWRTSPLSSIFPQCNCRRIYIYEDFELDPKQNLQLHIPLRLGIFAYLMSQKHYQFTNTRETSILLKHRRNGNQTSRTTWGMMTKSVKQRSNGFKETHIDFVNMVNNIMVHILHVMLITASSVKYGGTFSIHLSLFVSNFKF